MDVVILVSLIIFLILDFSSDLCSLRRIKSHRAKEREVMRKTRMERYILSMLASIMLSIVSNYLEILQGTAVLLSTDFNIFYLTWKLDEDSKSDIITKVQFPCLWTNFNQIFFFSTGNSLVIQN